MPPSCPSRVEQRVPVEEGFVGREEITASVSRNAEERPPYLEVEDFQGGAAMEISPLSDVSPSSVIVSSVAAQCPNQGQASRGTHKSHLHSSTSSADDKKASLLPTRN